MALFRKTHKIHLRLKAASAEDLYASLAKFENDLTDHLKIPRDPSIQKPWQKNLFQLFNQRKTEFLERSKGVQYCNQKRIPTEKCSLDLTFEVPTQ